MCFIIKTVIKNLSILTLSEILSRLIGLITTIYLARILLPEGFGQLSFAMAIVSFFVILSVFGLDVIGAKEITLNRQSREQTVITVIVFRFIISLLLIAIISLFAFFFIAPQEQSLTVMLYSLILISFGISTNFYFQGIEKMGYIALFRLLSSVMILVAVIVFVNVKEDVYLAAAIYSLSNIAVSILGLFIIYKSFVNFDLGIDLQKLKTLVISAYPLVISGIMIAIYYNLDIIMLRYMKTDYEVGIYSAAYKIFLVFIIPFGLIVQAYQPKLTQFISGNSDEFAKVLKGYSMLMLTFTLFAGISLFLAGDWLVLFLYNSEYLLAAGPLSLLALNVLLVGTNMLFGNPLNFWDKQKLYTVAVGLGAVSNIILNFLLIPKYSYIGAAFATLLSEAVVFVGVAAIFNKTITGLVSNNV